ncbi:hypothetical protein EXS65_03630 [Candidatus Peribacteria bacterium]|nr:hypothetical protein [Candidatus Peribacteria bacterium]
MQKNSLLESQSIDTALTGFLKTGIGESSLKADTLGRIRRSQERRIVSDRLDSFGSAMIEVLEGRSLPSGTTIDDLSGQAANLNDQIADTDTQISAIQGGMQLDWKSSTVAGWSGELPSTNGKYLCNSAVTVSGKYLVEGYNDGTIEIRNAESGMIEKTMKTGIGRAYFVVEDPTKDIVYVSAGESSGAIIAIDTVSGAELWRKATGGWTNAASVSPDGAKVMVDVDGKGVQIFDTTSGQILGSTNTNDYAGTALAGGKIATIRDWASLWIREANGSEKQVLSMGGLAYKVAVTPSGTRLAVAGAGGAIGVYDTVTGKTMQWAGEGTKIWSLTFTNDGTLVTAHRGGTVEFWDISGTTPVLKKSLSAGTDIVDEMYVQKENLIIQTRDAAPLLRSMKVENPELASQKASLLTQRSELQIRLLTVQTDLATAQEKSLAEAKEATEVEAALALPEAETSTSSTTPDESVSVLNAETVTVITETLVAESIKPATPKLDWGSSTVDGWDGELSSSRSSRLNNSAITASGSSLVMVYNDGTIEIRDAVNGEIRKSMNTGIGRGQSVTEDPTREVVYVSAGESNGALIAINTDTGAELWRNETIGWTNHASVSLDGARMIVDVDGQGEVILDAKTGQRLGSTGGYDYGGTVLPNGRITLIRNNSEVWLREADGTERKLLSLAGITSRIAQSQDGTKIAVASAGGKISLYDIASGQQTNMAGENTNVTELTFLGSGTLAVAHIGGTVEIWNVATAKPYIANTLEAGRNVVGELYETNGNLVMQTSENIPVVRTLKMPEVLPSAPLLEAVNIQGVNITIAASSPLEGENTVMFEGAPQEGFFTRATIEGSSNGNLTPVSITLNPTNPTGQYRVVLKSPKGTILKEFPVRWDADQKKLTLGNGAELWTSAGAQGKAMDQQAQELLAMSQNPTVVTGSVGQMQQSVLISTLPTLGAPYCNWVPTFQTAFFKAHPEWKDDVIHETARIAWENRTGNYTITQVYDRMMRDRTDLMSSLGAAYSQYYSMLSDLLQRGLSTLSDIRNGGNDERLRSDFGGVVTSYAGTIPMSQLSNIGISMPNADVILRTVNKIWNKNCEQIIETKAAENRQEAAVLYHEQLVANGFVEASDGTMVAATDSRATTGLVFFVDSFGRQTLIPQEESVAKQPGTTYGLDTTNVTLVASKNEMISSVYESIGLKLDSNGEFEDSQNLTIYPTHFGEITFTITKSSMVNMWTNGIANQDLSLNIKGGSSPLNAGNGYTSSKAGSTGESVSLRLNPGSYTLRVQDETNNEYMGLATNPTSTFPISVGVDIKNYNSARIEGMISIPESPEAMPVSMSVAEFDTSTGLRLPNPKNGLDSSKPVWVVVPGMDSHEDTGSIESVARELSAYGSRSGQVVTINWDEAAQALLKSGNDAPWTKAVGEWTASQLIGLGFDAGKINIAGHSHGTYVAFAAANKVMALTKGSQINAIVALDPAGNVEALSGFNDDIIKFSKVSRNSVAIEGSWMTGSNQLASSADTAFQIDSASTQYPWQEHGLPVTTFANILHSELLHPGQFPNALSLVSIMTPAEDQVMPLETNVFREFYEGVITIDTKTSTDLYGQYLIGIPTSVVSREKGKVTDDVQLIINPDASIGQP